MILAETREKCKAILAKIPRDAFIITVLILSSSASFGMGYMAAPVPEVDCALSQPTGTAENGNREVLNGEATPAEGRYVASKNGTKYYLPSCSGVAKIAEANKVWFATVSAAKAAGYSPAANCPGL